MNFIRFKIFSLKIPYIFFLLVTNSLALLANESVGDVNSKPLRIIVPFSPGGSNDIVGRALASELSNKLGRNVFIENRPGAGGVMGTEMAAHSDPDGNTLVLISSTFTMNPTIMKLNYDPIKSFVPVAMIGMGPSVIAVNAQLPVQNMREFVDYSKKNPGTVFFGSAGVASFQHFQVELLKLRSGADITTIHYKGGSPALVDLASGHIQIALGSLIQMQNFIRSGKVKLLAVAGPKRLDLIPNVPTLHESAIDMDASNWWAILAPSGTPTSIIDSLHRDINSVLGSQQMKQHLDNEGAEIVTLSRAELDKLIKDDIGKWAIIAKKTGIKAE
jgi:tripartite-type tricarboxylate transporter receptor subunit TctC